MIDKKAQPIICDIKNCRDSTLIKGYNSRQVFNSLIMNRCANGNFQYHYRSQD